MTDNEEALDDFLQKIQIKQPKLWLEHFARDQWTAACGITTKIPPMCDGSTSWFKYKELIDDWLDLTVLEESKRGPALMNRLISELQKSVKGLPNRESLRAEIFHSIFCPQRFSIEKSFVNFLHLRQVCSSVLVLVFLLQAL